jgi:four helix bundle protein
MLPHEKLEVYRKALDFVGDASAAAVLWGKRHAVADQFGRASASLILNLAEGARLRPERAKLRAPDYALGSCLECAARLDIEWIKGSLKIRARGKQHPAEHRGRQRALLRGGSSPFSGPGGNGRDEGPVADRKMSTLQRRFPTGTGVWKTRGIHLGPAPHSQAA